MLVLPIISKGRVLNVQIRLKNVEKIRKKVSFNDAIASDIIVNREKFSDSSYNNSKDPNATINFIKSRSMLYPRDFLVTTKEERDSTLYDVYRVPQPPKSVNEKLDTLYSKAINDLRKEIPNRKSEYAKDDIRPKGRCISFEDFGLSEELADENLVKLQRIVKEEPNSANWPKLFEKAGIADIPSILNFINNFECIIVSDYNISEKHLQEVINLFSIINSREYRNLKKYYHSAKTNTEIYNKIDFANRMIYDRPLNLFYTDDKAKKLVKVREENYEA